VASTFIKLPPDSGGGGGGAVDSFNGRTGIVVSQSGDYSGTLISNTPFGTIVATDVQAAINELDAEKAANPTGPNNSIVIKDGSGFLASLNGWSVNSSLGLDQNLVGEVTSTNSITMQNVNYAANALNNAPNNNFQADFLQINVDTDNDGFQLGTNGTGITAKSVNVVHQGQSDTGAIQFSSTNYSIGNGADPIDVRGIGYAFGFGQVNAAVTLSGPLQGYGFQPSVNAAATLQSGAYTQAFYDTAQISTASPYYTSYTSTPTIASIANNNNFTGLNISPTIPTFTGNAGFTGVAVGGVLGTFNSNGYYQGVSVNPSITSGRYVAGLQVSMDNVTPYAGVQASLAVQDITYTFIAANSFDNTYTLEYTPGATAGSEVVTIAGTVIEVQIETGVSTATQVKAAWDASPAASAINAAITGAASDPQVVFGPTNFAGGIDAGRTLAAYLDGDVEITGALTFGGALSIGKLNAFASQVIVDGGGTPGSIHSLVSNPTVAANATIANGDTLGINTAMLLTVGDNATVTTSLVGVAALALPAVVNMGTGSTIDQVSGGTFAISLDGAATGGTIANLDLCRSVAIPNGTTAITRMSGYKFDLPFGDPGTTTWGFYESPGVNNYFAGNLLVGGTAGSDDTVTNDSVAIEVKSTTKSILLSRMTTAERDALTAVNGMILYNVTTNKFQGYENGAWTNLI